MSPRVAFSSRPPLDAPLALKHENLDAPNGTHTQIKMEKNPSGYKIAGNQLHSDGRNETQQTDGWPAGHNKQQQGAKTISGGMKDESKNLQLRSKNSIGQSVSGRTKRASGSSGHNDQSHFSEEEIQFAEPVCRSVSQWVAKSESYDVWGNLVQIEQNIEIDGQLINQYFYETSCKKSKSEVGVVQHMACKGVDSKLYNSVCRDQYSWVYAYIRNTAGERGWSLIKLNTSCGCALIQRNPRQAFITQIQ